MFSLVISSKFIFFCNIFLYCSIYICFYWIDWLYSFTSLALNAILLISSVNTLYFLLVNLCCDFNIKSLIFMNSLRFYLRPSTTSLFLLYLFLFIFKLRCFQIIFINFKFKFSFYDTLFCAYWFFYFHHYHLLNSYMLLVSLQQLLIFH